MNQLTELNQEIQDDIQKLKSKKKLLKVLQEQEKKNLLFSETSFGKNFYRAVAFITSGISNLHLQAVDEINNPYNAMAYKLNKKCLKLLEKANKIHRSDSERSANIMALTMAATVMEIEKFLFLHKFHINETVDKYLESNCQLLQAEVERLRPPRDPEKEQLFRSKLKVITNNADTAGMP